MAENEQKQIVDHGVSQTANENESVQITYQDEDGQTVTTIASSSEAADIVSKAFTTVADGSEGNVEYITMTPEEAAAAGVVTAPTEEEEQVVTTSLQFDPANPSVLYTADGTPINRSDLTPEEQALVQAALQQHLAEQEADQQQNKLEKNGTQISSADVDSSAVEQAVPIGVEGNTVDPSTVQENHPATAHATTQKQSNAMPSQPIMVSGGLYGSLSDATVTSSGEPVVFRSIGDTFDLASPNTSASQIVQTLANNVRKRQLEEKLKSSVPKSLPLPETTVKYSEKIVIKEGQPQVVKVPMKKQPEIPPALATLMPKVEIGKDGSQVIRIHQSQITPGQLKALQENPNVRLVFRPATSHKPKSASSVNTVPLVAKKRGRPRKNPSEPSVKIIPDKCELETEMDDPPAKTRCGRVSKRPGYTKDYLTPKISKDMDYDDDDDCIDDLADDIFTPKSSIPASASEKRPRGRPPNPNKNIKRTSYASKIEALQNRDGDDKDLLMLPSKPALTPIEQALSTRRKNRLREMLSACSEDEIMEVAMPHIARVFSLWEFLVTKVEKNKMSRVFFADIYKEYECLHKYVAKLAQRYNQATKETQNDCVNNTKEVAGPEISKADKTLDVSTNDEIREGVKGSELKVTYSKLAESLGLVGNTLKETEISLLDPEEAIGPRIMGMINSSARRSQAFKNEDKAVENVSYGPNNSGEVKKDCGLGDVFDASKTLQAEATSTSCPISEPQNSCILPLKLMEKTEGVANASLRSSGLKTGTTMTITQAEPMLGDDQTMDTSEQSVSNGPSEADTAAGSGTQLIQIGQGEDQQFIEVPEGYTLIQTPEGLVMSQPGTTITQGQDGVIYITHADGTTTPLNAATQQAVQMETVESLLSLDGQQSQT